MVRAYVGNSQGVDTSNTPLKGVDGILGTVIMLAYYAGGTNIFPSDVDVEANISHEDDDRILITDQQLSMLVDECSRSIHRHIKSLTLGSMKAYLSWLRNGKRPNVDQHMPAIQTSYDKHGQIIICPRYFDEDVECGVFQVASVPDWVHLLATQQKLI